MRWHIGSSTDIYCFGGYDMAKESVQKKTNIVLIGFMGSGKTVIGRQTARLLDFDFADTDDEIRQVTGMELRQLFRKHGEIRFRSEERLVLQKLAAREHIVIACGGSLPPKPENLELLRDKGWFVLLTAKPEVIRNRLQRKANRLLTGSKPSAEHISMQAAAWEQNFTPYADFILDSGAISVDEAATKLAENFRAFCSQP